MSLARPRWPASSVPGPKKSAILRFAAITRAHARLLRVAEVPLLEYEGWVGETTHRSPH
jgi:hypothetical protein